MEGVYFSKITFEDRVTIALPLYLKYQYLFPKPYHDRYILATQISDNYQVDGNTGFRGVWKRHTPITYHKAGVIWSYLNYYLGSPVMG